MADWQKVFEDTAQYRVEIVKAKLEEHDIASVVIPKKDSSYQFGQYELVVNADDVIKALKIINEDIEFE